ncbi:MAG TPA: YciI family protein [Herpetosiphonaceae bacterium]
MRYIALIYGSEATAAQMTEADRGAEWEAYTAFGKIAEDSGCLVGGDALHPVSTATTVRVKNDTILTTDGPFAETKEQLGGFYIFNCENLDDAIALAAQIPGAKVGSVEVRPIMDF